jgi:3-hydroxymyristoyl/3-hydroxydecanoyl-(acyl carrier protein) dehydratase
VGVKCFTITEPVFAGHFDGEPVVPGVLIIEAIAQVAAVAAIEGNLRVSGRLVKVDSFKFLKPVTSGDQMFVHVEIIKVLGRYVRAFGQARVEQQPVAEGEVTIWRAATRPIPEGNP